MIDLLRERRSIREYTTQKIEREKTELLKEAVLRSPSSKNINPWEFIFVDNVNVIANLAACKPHGATPLKTAPLAVVICADETKNDVWIEDCSIAAILLQLTAQSEGLASCWIQVRNRFFDDKTTSEKFIQQLLNIPSNYRILCIISIGYQAKHRQGKTFEELQFEKIRTNRFS